MSGVNYIGPYEWETNEWYSMVIHSWDDIETGNTFVGQWFKDQKNDVWTLQSYFDTQLKKSALIGGFSLFQENYWDINAYEIREFYAKNMYIRDYDKNWTSLNRTKLLYDPKSWGYNSSGLHDFGATDEYFWGRAGGYVSSQIAYDASTSQSQIVTLNQPNEPNFGEMKIKDFTLENNGNFVEFLWDFESDSTPQLSFKIYIINSKKHIVDTIECSRPNLKSYKYDKKLKSDYTVKLEVTDIFENKDLKVISLDKEDYNIKSYANKYLISQIAIVFFIGITIMGFGVFVLKIKK